MQQSDQSMPAVSRRRATIVCPWQPWPMLIEKRIGSLYSRATRVCPPYHAPEVCPWQPPELSNNQAKKKKILLTDGELSKSDNDHMGNLVETKSHAQRLPCLPAGEERRNSSTRVF